MRDARKRKGLTLRDVSEHSGGAFRPNALAAWERGERHLSLERFCDLADFYEVPAERLLAEVLRRFEGRPQVIVDVSAIERLEGPTAEAVQGFVHQVSALRNEVSLRIKVRSGDLQVLSTTLGLREDELQAALQEALPETGTPRAR